MNIITLKSTKRKTLLMKMNSKKSMARKMMNMTTSRIMKWNWRRDMKKLATYLNTRWKMLKQGMNMITFRSMKKNWRREWRNCWRIGIPWRRWWSRRWIRLRWGVWREIGGGLGRNRWWIWIPGGTWWGSESAYT